MFKLKSESGRAMPVQRSELKQESRETAVLVVHAKAGRLRIGIVRCSREGSKEFGAT